MWAIYNQCHLFLKLKKTLLFYSMITNLMLNIEKLTNKLLNEFQNFAHQDGMRTIHLAIGIKNGKPITPIRINEMKTYVFGECVGSIHAEMSIVHRLLNRSNIHNFSLKDREKRHCILRV